MLTSLISNINILAASGIESALNKALLWIDQGVYWAVSKIFAVFMSICQINLTVLVGMMSDLINRAKALVIVFVVYKLAYALISNLNSPDKATDGTKKVLINVLIAASLLITYNLFFDIMNELSMMIVGKPDNYHYTKLSKIAGATDEADEGVLIRIFFGSSGNVVAKDSEGIGKYMAMQSLCATFPDTNSSQCATLNKVLTKGGEVEIKRLGNINPYLDKEVDGHPFVALGLGLYIIYSVGKAAIKVGVRMFKLIVLQIIAPIAIVSIIGKDGTEAKVFKNYVKAYTQVFISAFTHIGAIFLVTVFVSNFFANWQSIYGAANTGNNLTGAITMIIVIYAGYQFAGELPKFIEDILGKSLGGDFGGKGFGQFLTQAATVPIAGVGALAGGIGGSIAAARAGGGLAEMGMGGFAGAAGGFAGAFKGNTIRDKINNVNTANTEGVRNRAIKMHEMSPKSYAQGALLSSIPGVKGAQQRRIADYDREIANYDKKIEKYDSLAKIADEYQNAQVAGIKDNMLTSADLSSYGSSRTYDAEFDGNVKYGDSMDSFVTNLMQYDTAYNQAKTAYENDKSDSNLVALRNATNAARKNAEDIYKAKRDAYTDSQTVATAQRFNETAQSLGSNVTIGTGQGAVSVKDAKASLDTKKGDLRAEKTDMLRQKEAYSRKSSVKSTQDFVKQPEKK